MRVTGLFDSPLKSGRMRSQTALMFRDGTALNDRRWMLVDQTSRFVSQRTEPRLARVQLTPVVERASDYVDLAFVGRQPIRVSFSGSCLASSEPRRVTMHEGEPMDAMGACCGTDQLVREWSAKNFGRPYDLVWHGGSRVLARLTPGSSSSGLCGMVAFQDAYQILVATEASLAAVQREHGRDLNMMRFRPNIVVGGQFPAFDEDFWHEIKIGEIRFRLVKRCSRCAIPSVNPDTGAVDEPELLTTLIRMGRADVPAFPGDLGSNPKHKPMFAMNAISYEAEFNSGIRIGDPVEILSRHDRDY